MATVSGGYDFLGQCPDRVKHTRCPSGASAWNNWAEKKLRTHRQVRCKTCGFFAIWVPKGYRWTHYIESHLQPTFDLLQRIHRLAVAGKRQVRTGNRAALRQIEELTAEYEVDE